MDVVIKVDAVPKAGESCLCHGVQQIPGGKGANQAIAAARLNCNTSFFCKIGDDAYGRTLHAALKKDGVNVEYVKIADAPTGIAYILLEQTGQNRIIVDAGANMCYPAQDHVALEQAIERHDIILMQLEIPMETVTEAIKIARRKNKKIIVDAGPARKCSLSIFEGIDIISPNETETEALTGIAVNNVEDSIKAASVFLNHGIKSVVLKMGSRGAMYIDKTRHQHFPPYQTKVIDTTAAGDAFSAALSTAILGGKNISEAIDFANKVGALTVSKLGAQPSLPLLADVENTQWHLQES
jgi:ribokinase